MRIEGIDREIDSSELNFGEEFAPVYLDDGRCTYVNRKGERFARSFREACLCREGMMRVQLDDGRWAFIDRTGEHAFPDTFIDAEPFCGGLARVLKDYKPEEEWHYIDKEGKYRCKEIIYR